jgi:hypothetical protein
VSDKNNENLLKWNYFQKTRDGADDDDDDDNKQHRDYLQREREGKRKKKLSSITHPPHTCVSSMKIMNTMRMMIISQFWIGGESQSRC